MSINTRISLGVAFLSKPLSANSSARYIVHAEYIVNSQQYLLTKIKYNHNANLTLSVKSSETYCTNIADVLQRLSKVVAKKIEDGYKFDSSAMQIMEEFDETWGDFELSGESADPLLDDGETQEEILATVMQAYNASNRPVRLSAVSPPRNRKTAPVIANRIRMLLSEKASEQRSRMR